MKGSEIIKHITRDKMPDIEEIRGICLSRPGLVRAGRRIRLRTAVAIAAALILFAATAYAVAERLYQRVETGGLWDIMIFTDNEEGRQAYLQHTENRITVYGRMIYCGFTGNASIIAVNAERARFINDELAGQVFTAYGEAIDFELLIPAQGMPNFRQYHIYDRGQRLYTADGCRIGSVLFQTYADGEPRGVEILTKEYEERIHGFNAAYEEVLAALGGAFRLPTAHMDMFRPPRFNLQNRFSGLGWYPAEWDVRVIFSVGELNHIRDHCPDAMRISIERARYESSAMPPLTMYHLGGEATTHDISGVKVHELNLPEVTPQFTWMHDGFVYRLFPSPAFTHAQTLDVIRSMIE